MTQIALVWSIAIGMLLLVFLLCGIQKFRNEKRHHPLIEWDKGNDIHYEEEEENDIL